MKNIRWFIAALLFLASVINYIDRQTLSVVAPQLTKELHMSPVQYSNVLQAFLIAYTIMYLGSGLLVDRWGTKVSLAAFMAFWSVSNMLHAFARTPFQLGIFRALLGIGEPGNFMAGFKAISEWFPPKERAFVNGLQNGGASIGAIIAPPLIVWLTIKFDWRMAFVITGALGLVWLVGWLWIYGVPPLAAVAAAPMPKSELLLLPQTWGLLFAKFFSDPVWWFYLFWLPTYLTDVRHFTPQQRGFAVMIVYSISAVGALLGGVVSSFLMKRGWTVGKARKMTLLFCAIVMPACGLGVVVHDARFAVLLFGLATAAHQAWMTNLFIMPSDVFPSRAVGSTNGFGVCLGGLGGALFSGIIPGAVIPHVGYVPVLLGMSCFYIIAWYIIHRMMGELEMVTLKTDEPRSALLATSRA